MLNTSSKASLTRRNPPPTTPPQNNDLFVTLPTLHVKSEVITSSLRNARHIS